MNPSDLYKIATRITYRVASGTEENDLRKKLKIFIDNQVDSYDPNMEPSAPPEGSTLDSIIKLLQESPWKPHFPERQLTKYLTEHLGEENFERFMNSDKSNGLFKPYKFFESEICQEILKAGLERNERKRIEYEESQKEEENAKAIAEKARRDLTDAAGKIITGYLDDAFVVSDENMSAFAKLNGCDPKSDGYNWFFPRMRGEISNDIKKIMNTSLFYEAGIGDVIEYLTQKIKAAKRFNETS